MSMGQGMSNNVNELEKLLKTLTPKQLDFVRERMWAGSDAEAARAIDVAAETVSRWKAAGAPIDAIVSLARVDTILVARERLRRLVDKAIDVLEAEMMGKGGLRHSAAQEVLNRAGLDAPRKIDVTTGGDKIDFGGIRDLLARRLDTLLDA